MAGQAVPQAVRSATMAARVARVVAVAVVAAGWLAVHASLPSEAPDQRPTPCDRGTRDHELTFARALASANVPVTLQAVRTTVAVRHWKQEMWPLQAMRSTAMNKLEHSSLMTT